jgi:hypothetical protein
LVSVLVHHGGERTDLLQSLAWRHADVSFGAQPSPIVETILRDETQVGVDVVSEPGVDLRGLEVLRVGMPDRKIEPAYLPIGTIGDADSANMSITKRPARSTIGGKSGIMRFGVERNNADAP